MVFSGRDPAWYDDIAVFQAGVIDADRRQFDPSCINEFGKERFGIHYRGVPVNDSLHIGQDHSLVQNGLGDGRGGDLLGKDLIAIGGAGDIVIHSLADHLEGDPVGIEHTVLRCGSRAALRAACSRYHAHDQGHKSQEKEKVEIFHDVKA